MAEKSSTIDPKQPRKRKRTEKGQDWDDTIEKEMSPPKQIMVDQQFEKEKIASPKSTIADKPKKTTSKRKTVDKGSTEKILTEHEKNMEGNKQGGKKNEKAQEKQAKQAAEVETRKSMAVQFFNAASSIGNLENLTCNDITIINASNSHQNGQMTAEQNTTDEGTKLQRFNKADHRSRQSATPTSVRDMTEPMAQHRNGQLRKNKDASRQDVGLSTFTDTQPNNHVTHNGYLISPLQNNSNLINRQDFNKQTADVEQQYLTERETMTPGPNYGQVRSTRRPLQYQNTDQPPSEDFAGLIRSSMGLANGDDDVDDVMYMGSLDESSPLVNTVRCSNCEMLQKEIESLKENQMPDMPPVVRHYLEQLLSGGARNMYNQQSSQQVFGCTGASPTSSKHFVPGPGRQELYDGSGVFISKVEIQNIHIEAGKRPTEILNKLLGYFFDLKTLASQRNDLNDAIVHACTAYAKRCATVWKITDRIDYTKTIRNKRGSAKRKLERQLTAKKENVSDK